jgi:hypothetical protein
MKKNSEHIRNILIAASAAIPIAGGPISVILDKYLPSEFEERKNNFITALSEDLENIKDQISIERLQSKEYLTFFIKILKHSMEEHRKEKTIAFRNILINEAISKSNEFDETTMYIRLINDLTIDQIRILHYIYQKKLVGHCNANAEINIYKELKKLWSEIDYHYLLACVTELIRFFIITSSSEVQVNSKTEKGHALTGFGERFVKHIFSPIKMDRDT